MKKNNSIGVFDSGVGGTTILKEILKALPNENIIYYGDSGNAPYGQKSQEEIQKLCCKIMDFFVTNNCKVVVIACNTATAAALEIIQKNYSIPVIGVIQAGVTGAMKITKNYIINVLATPFTASSLAYTKELEGTKYPFKVHEVGCSKLCPMIEAGWENFPDRIEILKGYMDNLVDEADTLVLGCTHYPIIKKDISRFFKGNIVDPAEETALQLKNHLMVNSELNPSKEKGKLDFFVSGDRQLFKNVAEKFLGFSIDRIYCVDK